MMVATPLDQSPLVRLILKVVRQITGTRIALIARVTEQTWTVCAVDDETGFGLRPGESLELASTL